MTRIEAPLVRKRNKVAWIGLLILILAIAAVVLFFLFNHRLPQDEPPIVYINAPSSGNLAEINKPLQVQAEAEDFPGVGRLELYADGALVAVQESDLAGGSNPLVTNQTWVPLTLGRHALVARGYDNGGKFRDSSVVFVDVVELLNPTSTVRVDDLVQGAGVPMPSLGQVSAASGASVDDLRHLNPSLEGVDPTTPLPSGTDITVPHSPAPAPSTSGTGGAEGVPPAPLPGSPSAPTNVSAVLDCSSAGISWTASPEASDGYAIYRIGPGDISPVRVGTVGSAATSYTAALTSLGTYRYQVAALRSGLEGLSVYFIASTPESCASASTTPGTTTALVLNVTGLTTTESYDGVYCYLSFDQSAHLRVPATDFSALAPDGSGVFYDLQTQLPNRGMFLLSTHATAQPVTLDGECWGRRGPQSYELGSLSVSIPPSDWDGSTRHASLRQASLVASTANVPLFSDSFTLDYQIGYERPAVLRGFLPPYFGDLPPEELIPAVLSDPGFPPPYFLSAYFGSNPVRCTPSDAGEVCRAVDGLRLGWSWDGNQDLVGHFEFVIDGSFHISVEPDRREVSITESDSVASLEQILALHCGIGREIGYSLYVYDHQGEARSSADSTFSAPVCDTQTATVEVTLNNITVGPSSANRSILDNDTCIACDDTRMELIGYVGLTASRSDQSDYSMWSGSAGLSNDPLDFIVNYPLWSVRGIAGDVCGLQAAQCVYGPVATTSFNWSDLQLKTPRGLGRNQNVIHIKIRDGHTATLTVEIYDIPTGFAQLTDPFCVATIAFPWNSAQDWKYVVDHRTIDQDQGEASCHIEYTVRGSQP